MVNKFIKAGILSASLGIAGIGGKHGYDIYAKHKKIETIESAISQRDFVQVVKNKDIKRPLLCLDERIPGCNTLDLETKIQAILPQTLEPTFRAELSDTQTQVAQMRFPLSLQSAAKLDRISHTLSRDFKNISEAYTFLGMHDQRTQFMKLQEQVASIDAASAVEESRILLQEKKNPFGAWTRLCASKDSIYTVPAQLKASLLETGTLSYTGNIAQNISDIQRLGSIDDPYQPLLVDKKNSTAYAELEKHFKQLMQAHEVYSKIQAAAGVQISDPHYDSAKAIFMDSTLRFINLEIQKLQTLVQTPPKEPSEFRKNVAFSETLITGLLTKATTVDPQNPLLAANVALFHQAKEESLVNEIEGLSVKALQILELYDQKPYVGINQEDEKIVLSQIKSLQAQAVPLLDVLGTQNPKVVDLSQKMTNLELLSKRVFAEKHLSLAERYPLAFLEENFPGAQEYSDATDSLSLEGFRDIIDAHLLIANAHLTTLRLKTGVASIQGILPSAQEFAQYDLRRKKAQSAPFATECARMLSEVTYDLGQAKEAESYSEAQSELNEAQEEMTHAKKNLAEYRKRDFSAQVNQKVEQKIAEADSRLLQTRIYWEVRMAENLFTQYLENQNSDEFSAEEAKIQGEMHIKQAKASLESIADPEQKEVILARVKNVQALKEFRPVQSSLQDIQDLYMNATFSSYSLDELEMVSDTFEKSILGLNGRFAGLKQYAEHDLYKENSKRSKELQSSIFNGIANRAVALGRSTQNRKECYSAYALAISSTKMLVELGESSKAKKLEGLENLYKDACKPQKKEE